MNPVATVPKRGFVLAALLCLFVSNIQMTGHSQTTSSDPASNYYAVAGEQFLSQVQQAFLQLAPPANPAGFPLDLYTGDINPNNGTQQTTHAALFAQENMIRALYWGTRIFSTQFQPMLSNSVNQLAWYYSDCGAGVGMGFGTTRNVTCFFDDNAQLAGLGDLEPNASFSVTLIFPASAGADATPAGVGQGPNPGVLPNLRPPSPARSA